MTTINVTVNAGKEIAEISSDFTDPIEVIRESLHNAYDAGATKVSISAMPETLADGRRVLTLEFVDNGIGMSEQSLAGFFGLGHSDKPAILSRQPIGFKGHGTKIYYQAQDLFVQTRTNDGQLYLAVFQNSRKTILAKHAPEPRLFMGEEAEAEIRINRLTPLSGNGTSIRLVDYTADSSRLIDAFRFDRMENYLRWFTVYGSFQHVVLDTNPQPPFELLVQGIDTNRLSPINFGHPWPRDDRTDLRSLKKLDDRRPFNFFRKTFRYPDLSIEDGYRIDMAILFEGKRGRLERDQKISRQGKSSEQTIYTEEERYGLWLCRDFIPIERKFEWLIEEDCPRMVDDLRRPLIMVNSQDFKLIANRGSVGNSSQQLMEAVKRAVYDKLEEVQSDRDVERFLNEYQEDLFSRQREKDQKALSRRIDRFNNKKECEIILSNGKPYTFFEPQREITLFGLVSELQILDESILNMEILDYDDHSGIDLLVRKNGNPSNLLDKTRVAYVELKYVLASMVNHAFDYLYAVICWECDLNPGDLVTDAANNKFQYEVHKDQQGLTLARLVPLPDGKVTHNVKVILLQKLLEEKYQLTLKSNPHPVSKR